MNFNLLTNAILETHTALQQSAVKAINLHLTLRNWLIGFYIVEFEQHGEDRAKYGDKLLESLSKKLNNKSLSVSNLKAFRQFYNVYPQIGQSVIVQLQNAGFTLPSIGQSAIVQLKNKQENSYLQNNIHKVPVEKLLTKLSYTHLVQLFPISDPIKRTFYEIQAIRGTWSVSELKRQIASLYFERSGMSINPEKLSEITNEKAEIGNFTELIKSPFIFEFLGLKSHEAILEADLEAGLIEHLQGFIQELGNGFCFEARQKRIIIDDEYYFVDLVFYHRILKCHVLIELKADTFKTEYASQLNTYVAYYNAEVKQADDNPTVGILLCTQKGKKLVEYALAGMDKNLFVAKYLLQLPSEEQLMQFIENELKNI